MEFYPALRATMGQWEYYIVKMKMREVAKQIKFSSQLYESPTLDALLQRELNDNRVKEEIIAFLQNRPDRFFASLVVAAIGGSPSWMEAEISDKPEMMMLRNMKPLRDTFGILSFDGQQEYYALDGQHRLKAIQLCLDPASPFHQDTPNGFQEEEISVLVVVPDIDITSDITEEQTREFFKSYRRLFSSLNRYTKKTDEATNIIMDEDDSLALATRRLISEHPFFILDSVANKARIRVTSGKPMKEREHEFTSIEQLYELNITLLTDRGRYRSGWGDNANQTIADHKKQRPSEEYLEDLYQELKLYWDGILLALPQSINPGVEMRNHNYDRETNPGNLTDDLWFWPLGQILMTRIARHLLDTHLNDGTPVTEEAVNSALSHLSKIPTNLHEAPWKYFFLTETQKKNGSWGFQMRSGQRNEVLSLGETIVKYIIGTGPSYNDDDIHGASGVKTVWQGMLTSAPISSEEIDTMWNEIEALKLVNQSSTAP